MSWPTNAVSAGKRFSYTTCYFKKKKKNLCIRNISIENNREWFGYRPHKKKNRHTLGVEIMGIWMWNTYGLHIEIRL